MRSYGARQSWNVMGIFILSGAALFCLISLGMARQAQPPGQRQCLTQSVKEIEAQPPGEVIREMQNAEWRMENVRVSGPASETGSLGVEAMAEEPSSGAALEEVKSAELRVQSYVPGISGRVRSVPPPEATNGQYLTIELDVPVPYVPSVFPIFVWRYSTNQTACGVNTNGMPDGAQECDGVVCSDGSTNVLWLGMVYPPVDTNALAAMGPQSAVSPVREPASLESLLPPVLGGDRRQETGDRRRQTNDVVGAGK